MTDKIMVTHVVTSSGLLLHVVGSRQEVLNSFNSLGDDDTGYLWPVEIVAGDEFIKIDLNPLQVEMIERDHEYVAKKGSMSLPGVDDEGVMVKI